MLYRFCSDQYIMGAGGPVGLNLLAVDRAMDYFKIDEEERIEFYDKVRLISGTELRERYKDQESKMQQKK